MRIGCIKEIKRHEYRVGITPSDAKAFITNGHSVQVESDAGTNAGYSDEDYRSAGAEIISDKKQIFDQCEMIVKVKEPLPEEYELFKPGQILYTYLHLAANEELTKALITKKVNAVAYETIEENGQLPCLRPMSEIAGRLSIQEGAKYLEKAFGGRGVLLGGVPGIQRGKVAIIGGGVVGSNAAKIAIGMGAEVTILDTNGNRLAYLDDIFGSQITTLYSNEANIEHVLKQSDLVIGAVLVPGAKAPQLIRKDQLSLMQAGAVIVDVAIDQGGCVETSKPTTHDDPVYTIDGIIHYAVANMPGTVSISSTQALTNTSLRYGLDIANFGLEKAAEKSAAIQKGINTYKGHCTYKAVADAFRLNYTDLKSLL